VRAARRAAVLALLALLALLLGACSGDDGSEETTAAPPAATAPGATAPQPPPPPPVDGGVADEEPGEVLLRFVRAAEKGDAETMWSLLTEPTQASIGPTFDDFRGDAANTLQAGLGTLAPTAKVVLSRKLDDDWAVAAIAGVQEDDGGELDPYAYGAALLPENGKLKLELGGVVITGYKPAPTARIDEAQPTIAANAGAGGDLQDVRMWLDGEPFPAQRGENDTPFTATLRGEPAQPLAPGRHDVVVFAATADTATASAWSFTVEE
jgi:hypothetical protein